MAKSQEDILQQRIKELEGKIEQLRFSRRILMNLVERLEKEKLEGLAKLQRINRKLQTNNLRYVRSLWHKNKQIIELETKIVNNKVKNNKLS